MALYKLHSDLVVFDQHVTGKPADRYEIFLDVSATSPPRYHVV